MKKKTVSNDRLKYEYFTFLIEAKGRNEKTVDAVAKAISRFESYSEKPFGSFKKEQAIAFKKHLTIQENQRTGKPLSHSTIDSTLRHVKAFFEWLAMLPGLKNSIQYNDVQYLTLQKTERRKAKSEKPKHIPSVEEVRGVINKMPYQTDIERRDRALVAFVLLTGARNSAIISLKLKHVDCEKGYVFQDAREVNTKNSKTITTYFYPVGDDVKEIFTDWVSYLSEEKGFTDNEPLFPQNKIHYSKVLRRYEQGGLSREHWKSLNALREVFIRAFKSQGKDYYNPHSIRHALVELGEQLCTSPEEFKAWSQNVGHEHVMTTFFSYGEVRQSRQADIISNMSANKSDRSDGLRNASVDELLNEIRERSN